MDVTTSMNDKSEGFATGMNELPLIKSTNSNNVGGNDQAHECPLYSDISDVPELLPEITQSETAFIPVQDKSLKSLESIQEVNADEICALSRKNHVDTASMKKCYIVLEDICLMPSYRELMSQAYSRFNGSEDWPSSDSEFPSECSSEKYKNKDELFSASECFKGSQFQSATDKTAVVESPIHMSQHMDKCGTWAGTWKWLFPVALGIIAAVIYHILK